MFTGDGAWRWRTEEVETRVSQDQVALKTRTSLAKGKPQRGLYVEADIHGKISSEIMLGPSQGEGWKGQMGQHRRQ